MTTATRKDMSPTPMFRTELSLGARDGVALSTQTGGTGLGAQGTVDHDADTLALSPIGCAIALAWAMHGCIVMMHACEGLRRRILALQHPEPLRRPGDSPSLRARNYLPTTPPAWRRTNCTPRSLSCSNRRAGAISRAGESKPTAAVSPDRIIWAPMLAV
jgi:hypothetical protein